MIHLSVGQMARVAQMSGPIDIKFRQFANGVIVYLQIDGEYFKILNPIYLRIETANWLPNKGLIHVLRRKK